MRLLAVMIGLLGVAVLPYECGAQILDNPFAEYFERGLTISPSGGNANDANAAIHTIDPWPPYAGNTRISQTGRGGVNAVERMYTNCAPFPQAPQVAGSVVATPGGSSSGGGAAPASGGGGTGASTRCDFGGAGAWQGGGGGGTSPGQQPGAGGAGIIPGQ